MSLTHRQRQSLIAWLDARGLEPGAPVDLSPLQGGRSHDMIRLRRNDATWILRRPAAVALSSAAQGLRREFGILAALDNQDVPHPSPIALCEDGSVIGSTFYLMENVVGINPVPGVVDDGTNSLTPVAVLDAMTDALTQLHEVDWRNCGLADLGRPEGFHQRQAQRWAKQLRSYPGPGLVGSDKVATWLEDHVPDEWQPSVMHGDYHMLNILIGHDSPARVTAIVDWETATIGDPLLDLAGFTEVCSQTHRSDEGWPDESHVTVRYLRQRGLEEDIDLTYYKVLYNYRLAILLEGIYQRSKINPTKSTDHEIGERARKTAVRAQELIA